MEYNRAGSKPRIAWDSLRDIRVTLNRKKPDVVCELTWWWSSQWRTSTASEALHELERVSWGGERSKSWWWLLLSSENKTLWIGKLAHLIPGGDWSQLKWLSMITYHPILSKYIFLAVLGNSYSNSEGFMTRHGQVWEAIIKATFTTFCDLSDIRTKARLSVEEIIIRAVYRDQTFARRL